MFSVPPDLEALMDEAITHYPVSKRSAVLPLLHLVQEHFRYISDEAVEWVAKKLDLEPIKVLEVVTFYPGFRQTAPGRYHIRVCRSHTDHHHPIAVSEDGKYSVEFAECLACCGFGPVLMVDDDFYEKVDPAKVGDVLAKYQ